MLKKPNIDAIKISDLIPDDKNFNKGSETGKRLIGKSFQKFGAGRSILIDKNNRIIAGNKSAENAAAMGLEDVQIIESDGKRIIAVKRTDIDLDSPEGREMALADNASAKANIILDAEAIDVELGEIVANEWGIYTDDNIPSKTDLIEKVQLYQRPDFNYVAIFKKSKNGVELSKIKDPEYFDRMAYCMENLVKKYLKNKNTCLVCPPPRRHKDWNLAQQMVKHIGEKNGFNYDIDLFEAKNLDKYNPSISLKKELAYDNYVMIDDIITTGITITTCISLLEDRNFMSFVLIKNS